MNNQQASISYVPPSPILANHPLPSRISLTYTTTTISTKLSAIQPKQLDNLPQSFIVHQNHQPYPASLLLLSLILIPPQSSWKLCNIPLLITTYRVKSYPTYYPIPSPVPFLSLFHSASILITPFFPHSLSMILNSSIIPFQHNHDYSLTYITFIYLLDYLPIRIPKYRLSNHFIYIYIYT